MISTLKRGIHVIATRESLRWPEAKWRRHKVSVEVTKLPEEEARKMIRQRLRKAGGSEFRRAPVRDLRCTPFYIESAIRLYLDLVEEEVEATDLPSTPKGAVIGRRPPAGAAASSGDGARDGRALIQPYQHMADVLNVELAVLHYQDFTDSFLTERVSGSSKLHGFPSPTPYGSRPPRKRYGTSLRSGHRSSLGSLPGEGEQNPDHSALLRGLFDGWISVSEVPRRSCRGSDRHRLRP